MPSPDGRHSNPWMNVQDAFQCAVELGFEVDIFKDYKTRAILCLVLDRLLFPSENHDGNTGGFRLGLQLVDEMWSIHLWHLQIGNDDVRLNGVEHLQGFQAIGGGFHTEPALFQEAADRMPDEHGIIDY